MLTIDASTVNEIRELMNSTTQGGHGERYTLAELHPELYKKLPSPDKDECPLKMPEAGGCVLYMKPYERAVFGNATDPLGFAELRYTSTAGARIRFWFPHAVRIFRGKVADRIVAEHSSAKGEIPCL